MQAGPPNLSPAVVVRSPFLINLPIYISVAALFCALAGIHSIPEGHVGVYWRGGKLLRRVTGPGLHSYVPVIDRYEAIQVTMQTDKVEDITCGTKSGVTIKFEKIEVVNRLRSDMVYDIIKEYGVFYDHIWIYDKIHHEINQFCSSHTLQEVYIDKFDQVDDKIRVTLQNDINKYAPGIEIISVRITKPKIPEAVMANYVAMEVERTKVLVAEERKKVLEKEAETQRAKAIAEAETLVQTSRILQEKLLAERLASQQQEVVRNEIFIAKEKAATDAGVYRIQKEAEANTLRLTPEFLEYAFIQAVANNTKVYYGDKLPHMVLNQRLISKPAGLLKAGSRISKPAGGLLKAGSSRRTSSQMEEDSVTLVTPASCTS